MKPQSDKLNNKTSSSTSRRVSNNSLSFQQNNGRQPPALGNNRAFRSPPTSNNNNSGPFPVDSHGEIIPGEYHLPGGTAVVKKIQPAAAYDVVSFARAMNTDFAGKVKTLFDQERQAVEEAIQTGLYVSWRPIHKPYNIQDCQRVSSISRCFCGHQLDNHDKFTGREVVFKCLKVGCGCKNFEFIISTPEQAGEYWLRKTRNFDIQAYRAMCRCKHTHEQHDVQRPHRCKARGCGCSTFNSSWVCAACDQHWHDHETVFETEKERRQEGRPVGEDWYPFAEMPDLKHIVITGQDTIAQSSSTGAPSLGSRPRQGGNRLH